MHRTSNIRRDRAAAILFFLAVFFFILTFSISMPIYVRPFYYAHIEALDLPGVSGFAADQIMEAYNEVLDYLTLPGREFGTGDMAWSESGKAHFEDCKALFDLNAGVLAVSAAGILVLLILRRMGRTGPLRLGRHSAAFWAAVCAPTLPVVIGALAALDFDRAFVIFHSIFFPGKDNWIFNWYDDQIIRVLPQQFFMNCAILIGAGILTLSLSILAAEIYSERNNNSEENFHDRQA